MKKDEFLKKAEELYDQLPKDLADYMLVGFTLETRNYDQFKRIEGNRNISPIAQKKLKRSILEKGQLQAATVNSRLEIIDGQNRRLATQTMSKPFRFTIVSNYGLEEVQRVNSGTTNWRTEDYVKCYSNLGNISYQNLTKLKNMVPELSYSNLLNVVLDTKNQGGEGIAALKAGRLYIPTENIQRTISFVQKLQDLKPLTNEYNKRSFVIAYMKCLKNPLFNHTEFVLKLSNMRDKLYPCVDWKQYLERILSVYNYRNRKPIRIDD